MSGGVLFPSSSLCVSVICVQRRIQRDQLGLLQIRHRDVTGHVPTWIECSHAATARPSNVAVCNVNFSTFYVNGIVLSGSHYPSPSQGHCARLRSLRRARQTRNRASRRCCSLRRRKAYRPQTMLSERAQARSLEKAE